jgi:hypothetical protein
MVEARVREAHEILGDGLRLRATEGSQIALQP